MASPNPLNVYKGPDSVQRYFDPDSSPPLPLVELPDCLNPYRGDGVRIYAKMMTMHPANNVKSMPALNLLQNSVVPEKTETVVEYSSGSTVLSMSMVSRVFYGLDDVRAFLSNKTSLAKIRLMQFFGIRITLFGGPSQPEPLDERGGIRAAQRLAQESERAINPNQYENDDNWKAHIRWTGPQISSQLPEINLICAGMGTSGTMTGLGTYFHDAKPSVFRLGVCTAAGDRVPGPRSFALLAPVEFPWKAAVDHIEEVGSHDSYALSLELCRQGLVGGPSSGFNLRGLYQFLDKRKEQGDLAHLAGPDGHVHCVFLCCDLPYQYVNEYFDKLGHAYFPPITNENLLGVDLYRYDERWERPASEALGAFFDVDTAALLELLLAKSPSSGPTTPLDRLLRPQEGAAVVDLRQPADFARFRLPASVNLPLAVAGRPSPFSDPDLLASLWRELEATFTPGNDKTGLLGHRRLLIVCYDGDSSRVATSVLRAKGHEADNMRGGLAALDSMRRREGENSASEADRTTPPWLDLGSEALGIALSQSAHVTPPVRAVDL